MPESLLKASEEEKRKVFNTCGPDGFINRLIPNSIMGADITDACNIHDWEFHHSKSREDLKKADENFSKNIKHSIEDPKDSWLKKGLKKVITKIYYLAVRLYSSTKGLNN